MDADGHGPVPGISVVRVAANGTRLGGTTDEEGLWIFDEHYTGTVTVLLAGHGWDGQFYVFQPSEWVNEVSANIGLFEGGGSAIFENGTGHIKGVSGRLNPIRDTADRTYIYGDNISFGDSPAQPFQFSPGEPFDAEDAHGHRISLTVPAIVGRTSLVRYRYL